MWGMVKCIQRAITGSSSTAAIAASTLRWVADQRDVSGIGTSRYFRMVAWRSRLDSSSMLQLISAASTDCSKRKGGFRALERRC